MIIIFSPRKENEKNWKEEQRTSLTKIWLCLKLNRSEHKGNTCIFLDQNKFRCLQHKLYLTKVGVDILSGTRPESYRIGQVGYDSSTKQVNLGTMDRELIGSCPIFGTTLRTNSEFGLLNISFCQRIAPRCTKSSKIRPQNYLTLKFHFQYAASFLYRKTSCVMIFKFK